MKRTLLITLDFYPQTGGIAQYWKHLGVCFDPQKWIVLALPLPFGMQELQTSYRIIRKSFFSKWVLPRWIKLFFVTLTLIKREQIEVVVVSHLLPVGTILWLCNFFIKIPTIIVSHGMDASLPHTSFRKKILCKFILNSAYLCIANSEQTARNLMALGCPKEKITTIYPCPSLDFSDTDASIFDSKRLLEEIAGKRVLLSVSRLVERKGHEYVLRALPSIRTSLPDCVYVIIGDGPHRAHLEQKVKELRLESCVFFCGELRGKALCDWYSRCDLFILTPFELSNRDTEGFGIVYLEANSFEKPVIGSRCGGVPDAIIDGETGLLVDQKNSNQITKSVVQLLDNAFLAKKLGLNGKIRVQKEFQWEQTAEKYKSILS